MHFENQDKKTLYLNSIIPYRLHEFGGTLKWFVRLDGIHCVDPAYFDEWRAEYEFLLQKKADQKIFKRVIGIGGHYE